VSPTISTITAKTKTEAPSRLLSRIRIGPRSAGRLMSREEFDALRPEQFIGRNRYELINGVLVVSPRAGIGERNPNDELGYLIRLYRDTPPHGSIIDGTVPEQTVPATNSRIADRVIWTGLGRAPDEDKDIPSIVIEFVSKRRRDALRDYELKRDEYLRAGVQEYWIIDRFRRVMMVYRQGIAGPTYDIVTETQTYQTDLLPGFVLPLSKLLALADQGKRKQEHSQKTRKSNPPAGGTDG
jgi:Uma2 family endonuclease